ncbi:LysM peptidoglycan-binding domain-containing protein [Paenibacillus sp. BR2-3]|uniref:LysM peptidoglycan-binding domain-containing protein n=1 Tax=Paenibacillus sp. BR2-3 TaxID=3048494 RepID=UPI0039773406
MFDQSHGLRFDIYERIHLPQELPGIAELEEVELLPEIQVIQREDRAELYGQLLLTGLYRSEDDRTQRLEHAIPVEITVPLTRVSSFEDIGVEIENFDIDLLTMRSVNITGVLSLRGIRGTETVPDWQQEEYTVAYSSAEEDRALSGTGTGTVDIHEREGDALYENSQWTFGEGAFEESALELKTVAEAVDDNENSVFSEQEKDKELLVHTHSISDATDGIRTEASNYWNKSEAWNFAKTVNERKDSALTGSLANTGTSNKDEAEEAALNVFISEEGSTSTSSGDEAYGEAYSEAFSKEKDEADSSLTPANEGYASSEIASIPEEKPDLKIALGSNKEPKAEEKEHFTFSSLLNSSRSRKEQEDLSAGEAASDAAAASVDTAGDREWKNRFIGGIQGADLFRKVRLCIVQREETLDTIAEKYQLSARELVMYNRLSGQNVEEGQVLYIP